MTTLREAAQMALDALDSKHDMTKAEWRVLQYHAFTALRAALAQPETPYLTGARLFREGKGVSFIPTAVRTDADIGEALQGWEDAKTSEEIAQPEQEPPCKTGSQCVGGKCERCAVQEPWGYISHRSWKMPVFVEAGDLEVSGLPFNNPDYTPVYKAPPQREWQGLTDEDIEDACWTEVDQRLCSFARAIEAALRSKNT